MKKILFVANVGFTLSNFRSELIKKFKGIHIGFACLIDRSDKKSLKIKNKLIISQVKINVPTFKKDKLPNSLKKIPVSSPGSRRIK